MIPVYSSVDSCFIKPHKASILIRFFSIQLGFLLIKSLHYLSHAMLGDRI